MNPVLELMHLIRARYPLISIVSSEEARIERAILTVAKTRTLNVGRWSMTEGMAQVPGTGSLIKSTSFDPYKVLDEIMTLPKVDGGYIFILRDYHRYIDDPRNCRRLRDLVPLLSQQNKCMILLGPVLKIPAELEKDITVLDWPHPNREEMGGILGRSMGIMPPDCLPGLATTPEGQDRIVDALMGLTATEADNVLAKSIVSTRTFDPRVIMGEKRNLIRKSGILDYCDVTTDMKDVGGLPALKEWLDKRHGAFTPAARACGLPTPKGMLMVGVPGCGKSLTARAVAASWGMPLIRLDVGKIFGGLVGASEENIRKALRVAEAAAPCILWLDEIEKGFSGTGSSDRSDGGTTSRVFGTFITWMQEKTAPVFVIATANNIAGLPPEMLRKGRFDELFFVDLPTEEERHDILQIHLAKKKIATTDIDVVSLAQLCNQFSGAELEQVVTDAMYEAFDGTQTLRVTTAHLRAAANAIIPLAETMRSQIEGLRQWAKSRARLAGVPALAMTQTEGRSLD